MGIIGQLRPGMDLSKITLPTFILEPKSMLERITKYAPLACIELENADLQLHGASRVSAAYTQYR